MLKYQTGIQFYNYRINDPRVIVGYNELLSRYLIQSQAHAAIELWSEADIDHVMNMQDVIVNYAQKQKEQNDAEAKRKQTEIDIYNDVDGFCDNMTELQKGKMLKTLNRTIQYEGRLITRKDWVKKMMNTGYEPSMIDKRTVKDYVLVCGNSFFEISKTEYNYAVYLSR